MKFEVFGPEGANDDGDAAGECFFVLGWGNRPDHEPVRWLIDRLIDEGWRVHTATLPVHVTDVQREWVAPVERYAADLAEFALLAHSAGGLTAAHASLHGATTRTYLSPGGGIRRRRVDVSPHFSPAFRST